MPNTVVVDMIVKHYFPFVLKCFVASASVSSDYMALYKSCIIIIVKCIIHFEPGAHHALCLISSLLYAVNDIYHFLSGGYRILNFPPHMGLGLQNHVHFCSLLYL